MGLGDRWGAVGVGVHGISVPGCCAVFAEANVASPPLLDDFAEELVADLRVLLWCDGAVFLVVGEFDMCSELLERHIVASAAHHAIEVAACVAFAP